MSPTSAKEFVSGLNELRQAMERSRKIYEELGRATQNVRIRKALEARVLISTQGLRRLDECFKMIGEKLAELSPRVHELFMEELREQLNEIQSPEARRMFVLDKASRLGQMHEAVYLELIEAADELGYPAIGLRLETCLSDRRVFAERTNRLIGESREQRTLTGGAGSL